jgi:hypothetical protein
MSSWIIAKSIPRKVKAPVTTYHDTTHSPDIPTIYMDFLAAYIYSQKNGETCSVWDPTGVIKSSLKSNPQIIHLKENLDINPPNIGAYKSVLVNMKLKDIQKMANQVLEYSDTFKMEISNILRRASIREEFDIGLHYVPGTNIGYYIDILKAYQLKTKKTRLSIYMMANSYDMITEMKKYSDPTWTYVSLSKNKPTLASDVFIQNMAEVQIMIKVPALVLNFALSIDRYIYLMNDGISKLNFFKEANNTPWSLV